MEKPIKEQKPTYDPNKNYTWRPNDIFYINGGEFGLLLEGFKAILRTPEAQTVMVVERAFQIMQDTLVRAVETGVAQEQVPPKPEKDANEKGPE